MKNWRLQEPRAAPAAAFSGGARVDLRDGFKAVSRAGKIVRVAHAAQRAARADGENRAAAQSALAHLLADARGVPMKVGQFLASLPGNEAFDALVKGIAPRPLSEIAPPLEAALGRPLDEVFSQLDESQSAASLGQVHRAVLHDGKAVAVKVQYPDIRAAVEGELALAGLMPGLGPAKQWGFDVDAYKRALRDDLEQELDYASEAKRQEAFGRNVRVEGLVTPGIVAEWTRGTVIVQDWVNGVRLDEVSAWSPADRRRIGTILAQTLFASLFNAGTVHGDPNLGNLYIRRNRDARPEVVLLDYGCVVDVPRRARLALLKLILGTIEDARTEPFPCFVEMGFDAQKLEPIAHLLPALCTVLFEPFADRVPYSTRYWALNERMSALLGDLRWWFRSAGPAHQFLLMRAFSGLVSHLTTLQVVVSWQSLLYDAVDPGVLEEARQFKPSPVSVRSPCLGDMAKLLKVVVSENGRQVVQVAMPSTQVAELESIIPPEVLPKIRAAGLDLAAIVGGALSSGLTPQELFTLDASPKQYRVWLE